MGPDCKKIMRFTIRVRQISQITSRGLNNDLMWWTYSYFLPGFISNDAVLQPVGVPINRTSGAKSHSSIYSIDLPVQNMIKLLPYLLVDKLT